MWLKTKINVSKYLNRAPHTHIQTRKIKLLSSHEDWKTIKKWTYFRISFDTFDWRINNWNTSITIFGKLELKIYIIISKSVCVTAYRLVLTSFRHETGIIRTNMIWSANFWKKFSEKLPVAKLPNKMLRYAFCGKICYNSLLV